MGQESQGSEKPAEGAAVPTEPSAGSVAPISRRQVLTGGVGLAAAGVAGSLLAACGSTSSSGSPNKSGNSSGSSSGSASSGSSSSGGSSSSSKGKTKLTLMTWELFEPGEIKAWRKVINDFTTANPSIEVVWTGYPFANYDQNVIAQAQAGHINADVVMCPPELGSTLIMDYDMCEPLGFIAKEVGLTPNGAHEQFIQNGQLYLLGVLEVAVVNSYDKRLLEKAGFSAAPTTTDAMLEVVKKCTKPPHQYGTLLINTAAAAADMWNQLQNWTLAFDGVWASGKKLTINSKENIQGVQNWVDLVKASGLAGTGEAALDKLWYNDQIVTNIGVVASSAAYKTLAPKLFPNLQGAPPPWPSKKAIARLHGDVVLKNSAHKEAAYELVKWMVEPKNLYYVYVQNGYALVPYNNIGQKIPQYAAHQKSVPYLAGFDGTHYVGESDILGEYVYAYAEMGNLICTNAAKAVSGSATVEEALGAAQSAAEQSLHPPS